MTPRAKHIPDHASKTTIRLTDDEMAAINWIRMARSQKGNDRKTLNDILVDGLWLLLDQEEGKTQDEIRATIPQRRTPTMAQDKVTRMPKPKRR